MLSNAYFLAKFRIDTAENEPAKNLQSFAKLANFASKADVPRPPRAVELGPLDEGRARVARGAPRVAVPPVLQRVERLFLFLLRRLLLPLKKSRA